MEPFARKIGAARSTSCRLARVDWNAELGRGDLANAVHVRNTRRRRSVARAALRSLDESNGFARSCALPAP
jgi:hypothetical protein